MLTLLALIDTMLILGVLVLIRRVNKLEDTVEKMNADMFWSKR